MLIDTSTPSTDDVPLDMDAATARGSYSNVAIVAHTKHEFVLDFAFVGPAHPSGLVVSRVVMHPAHAMALLRALGENSERYIAKYGNPDAEPPASSEPA